jgi:hypothetical protein
MKLFGLSVLFVFLLSLTDVNADGGCHCRSGESTEQCQERCENS